jgi:hypothetical protein
MPLAGFEPTIPVFKRAKAFHALDRAAAVTGTWRFRESQILEGQLCSFVKANKVSY